MSSQAEYIETFKMMSIDSDMQILAEEGMGDYLDQLKN